MEQLRNVTTCNCFYNTNSLLFGDNTHIFMVLLNLEFYSIKYSYLNFFWNFQIEKNQDKLSTLKTSLP